jgi:hypothetical protein
MFIDIQNASDQTWHTGLLYNLIKLLILCHLVQLISSFLQNLILGIQLYRSIYDYLPLEISKQEWRRVLSLPLHSASYINDVPTHMGVCMTLFTENTFLSSSDINVDMAGL